MARAMHILDTTEEDERLRRNRKLRGFGTELFFYALMTVLAIIFLAPLAWMITASLKVERDVMAIPPTFLPRDFQWQNYRDVWEVIPRFLWNSVKLAAFNVVGVLFVTSLAAYAFARMQFRGRDVAFSILLSTLMVPGIVTLIPLYIIYREIGWVDTHYPLWVPRVLHSVFAIFLLRQFFKQIPQDLEDAARLDGASTFEIYWRIMLPQVMPALAAVAIFTFLDSWNDLFGPLIFLNSPELQTLPVALKLFQGEYFSQVSVLMAAATVSIIPVMLVFFAAQKYFLRGIVLTGLK
ncbi:MAG: carbohydrate ABC transporter permease [Chloroflexia bacterium]|nr:carbohydrate ABC transporter permease [Chloroflexia bacterium]